jgi:hypothetical protein
MPSASPVAAVTDLDRLYSVAVWMYETRDAARTVTLAAVAAHPGHTLDELLGFVCRPLLGQGARSPRDGRAKRLRALDDVLRSSMTIPISPDHPLVRGELRRLRVLESELKRSCLWAVLRGLRPMPRAAFVLESMLGCSLERISAVCGITVENAGVARRRARRALEDYLSTRCEHLDPRNMCHCRSRLGVALDQGFIDWPAHDEHDAASGGIRPGDELSTLYAALPLFRLDGAA